MPENLVILVVPFGAEAAAISHGTVAYVPYRADHRDPASIWLVAVPPAVAIPLCHNAGFYRYE